jgi:DNA-directed RNA polymerase subunit K/omega
MKKKDHRIWQEAVTRDIKQISEITGNIYLSTLIIGKRANQISQQTKEELDERLSEFKTTVDTLEEYIENKAQIEVAREYEMKPKPTLIATKEFLNKKYIFEYQSINNH